MGVYIIIDPGPWGATRRIIYFIIMGGGGGGVATALFCTTSVCLSFRGKNKKKNVLRDFQVRSAGGGGGDTVADLEGAQHRRSPKL